MIEVLAESATSVRKEWSAVCDSVVRQKPKFIKRTHDKMLFASYDTILTILNAYRFTAAKYVEDDGSITLSLNEIDLIENAPDECTARLKLAKSILDYSMDYYNEYELYSHAPNRKNHIPYVLKALMIDDEKKIGDMLECQNGEN